MKKAVFWLFCFSLATAQSDHIVIDLGTDQSAFSLEAIKKVHFTTQETHALVITKHDGGISKFKLYDIDQVQFIQLPTSVDSRPGTLSFVLHQNYPNPFNPATKIHYHIRRSGWVELKIFNIQGQIINPLTSAYREPGQYEIEWTGTDFNHQAVPNGIYFCQIRMNQQTMTIKMLLNR